MNALNMARTAYTPAATPIRSHRATEYEAFVRVTRALKAARTPSEIAGALHENRQLWQILAEDVAEPANGLPDALRAGIMNLATFTNRHTSDVLRGVGAHTVLVEINAAVMRGLRQSGAEEGGAVA